VREEGRVSEEMEMEKVVKREGEKRMEWRGRKEGREVREMEKAEKRGRM
jgi:hypothetical protein